MARIPEETSALELHTEYVARYQELRTGIEMLAESCDRAMRSIQKNIAYISSLLDSDQVEAARDGLARLDKRISAMAPSLTLN